MEQGDPKSKVVACMNCRKNHKKCDGKKPSCSFCKRKGFECVENTKRKSVGRPKKSEDNKRIKKEEKTNELELVVVKKAVKSPINSEIKKIEKTHNTVDQIIQENEMLKIKLQEMMGIIQMNMFAVNQLWLLTKTEYRNGVIVYPMPSYIIEASPAFNNLVGYNDVQNLFFPNMIPSKRHIVLNNSNFQIKMERIEGLPNPRLTYGDNLYIKHSKGHFLSLKVQITLYFDSFNKLPTMRMIYINQILSLNVEEKDIPHLPFFFDIKFYCNTNEDLPDLIKKLHQRPATSLLQSEQFINLNTSKFTDNTEMPTYLQNNQNNNFPQINENNLDYENIFSYF